MARLQQYWGLARVGRRFGPRLSLGLEGGALGNEEYAAGRGGGFVRAAREMAAKITADLDTLSRIDGADRGA